MSWETHVLHDGKTGMVSPQAPLRGSDVQCESVLYVAVRQTVS